MSQNVRPLQKRWQDVRPYVVLISETAEKVKRKELADRQAGKSLPLRPPTAPDKEAGG